MATTTTSKRVANHIYPCNNILWVSVSEKIKKCVMAKFKNESEVAEVVVRSLKDLHYEVYCEVEIAGFRADIVGVLNKHVLIVEVKNQLTLDVLGQAIDRRRYAHYSVAAFPMPKDPQGYKKVVLSSVSTDTGIGIWAVNRRSVKEMFLPSLNKKGWTKKTLGCLRDEQKDQKAGVNNGHWSPFRDTKEALIEFVRKNPGCSLRDAIRGVDHHYKRFNTAYSCLSKYISNGTIKEIVETETGYFLAEDLK